MPATAWVDPTGDQDIDGILSGVRWDTLTLTYSFPRLGSYYGSRYGQGENVNGFEPLNAAQQAAARRVFATVESLTNLDFVEVAESAARHADLRLAQSNDPSTAWAYLPSTAAIGGDSWYNNAGGYYDNPVRGNYAFATFVHEIGHALGLKHGHEDGPMTPAHDSMEYSIMTYRSHVGDAPTGYDNEPWGFAQSWMMADIAALQHMYGADFTHNAGNTTYRWNSLTGDMLVNGVSQGAPGGNRIFMTLWDGGGVDTYDFSNYATNLVVDLRPGGWTTASAAQIADLGDGFRARGNVANALLFEGDARSLIENAVGGSGNDAITGNEAANVLTGGAGDDLLSGGAGRDLLNGGLGRDTFRFDAALDGGFDRILNWAAEDTIVLSRAVFAALAPGALAPGAFQLGTEALQLDDRILYDQRTGTLFYDADGRGAGFDAEAFAVVANRVALTAADFTAVNERRAPPAPGDDYADSLADTSAPRGALPIGSLRTGSLEVAGDRDLFAVNLVAGRTYRFDLTGAGGDAVADPYLRLLGPTGTELRVDDDSGMGLNSQMTFTATVTGQHFLLAGEYGDNGSGTYRIGADLAGANAGQPSAATAADDYADRLSDRSAPFGSLAGGGPRTGTVEVGGDWDVFAVGLVAGRTYSFSLRGVDSGGGSLGDPYLHLLNRGGGVLAVDDDSGAGKDSQITFTATYTGRHYLTARSFSSFATGDYTIQASVARAAAAAPNSLAALDPLGAPDPLAAMAALEAVEPSDATVPTPSEWLRPDDGF